MRPALKMATLLPRKLAQMRMIRIIVKRSLFSCNIKRVNKTSTIFSCCSRPEGRFYETYLPFSVTDRADNKQDHHKKYKNSFYTLAFLSFAYTMLDEDNKEISTIINNADALYEKNETKQLYEYLSNEMHQKNAEVLWRFARAARDFSQLPSITSDMKKRLTYEGFAAAEEAISLDDKSFACHKWYGIMLSEVGDYEGTKKKIENSFKIRDHFLKAIELNPTDATSHYLLGVWFFTFADLPWYQRKLAATIFASPPSCTYEEAQSCFLHAESIDPGFYSANQLMLAKTYMRLGFKEEAKSWLDKLICYQAKTESDIKNIKEGKGLLKSL